MSLARAEVGIRRGRVYLARSVCDAHFAGCSGVILLRKDTDVLVLPVQHAASGGYVLKIRNSAGDRVVDAGDFLRDHGFDDGANWESTYSWCEMSGGLRLYEVFRM